MKTTLKLTLERPARKGGGDRYEAVTVGKPIEPFHIYLPQLITRIAGVPITNFEMTLYPKGGD